MTLATAQARAPTRVRRMAPILPMESIFRRMNRPAMLMVIPVILRRVSFSPRKKWASMATQRGML